jgi:hypothetical protein
MTYLIIMFGNAFLGIDLWAITFATREEAEAWILEQFGMSYEDMMQAYDLIQMWFDNDFTGEQPFTDEWIMEKFFDDDQEAYDYACEQAQMQMPYGFYEMPNGESRMVIGQSSFM